MAAAALLLYGTILNLQTNDLRATFLCLWRVFAQKLTSQLLEHPRATKIYLVKITLKISKNYRSDEIHKIQAFKKYSSIQVFKYRVYKLVSYLLRINNVKSRDPLGFKNNFKL